MTINLPSLLILSGIISIALIFLVRSSLILVKYRGTTTGLIVGNTRIEGFDSNQVATVAFYPIIAYNVQQKAYTKQFSATNTGQPAIIGEKVTIYFNSQHPERAYLRKSNYWISIGCSLITLIVCLYVLLK